MQLQKRNKWENKKTFFTGSVTSAGSTECFAWKKGHAVSVIMTSVNGGREKSQ
jgi:hypothetical protein